MSDKIQETVLSNLTDDMASSFFEGGASSGNVILPDEPNQEPAPKTEPKKEPAAAIKHPINDFDTTELIGDLLGSNNDDDNSEPVSEPQAKDDDQKRPVGRPKKIEGELGFDIQGLYEDETLLPFDSEEQVKTIEDLKELIKANKVEERNAGKAEAINEYKESLPESLRYILDYTESGGTDIDSFLKALGQANQVRDLDISKEFDQKEVLRQYYALQEWSPEEIEEEIESLLDLGEDKLKVAASRLKPKLDKMQEQNIQYQLARTKQLQEQQAEAQKFYVRNVVDSLKKGALNDMKISRDEQRDLYSALVEERYQSVNGGVTNRLGALLDKIQYVEPNYELLAEVTMLLSDPAGYKTKIREQVKKEVTADTIKKVKTEQGLKKSGTSISEPEPSRPAKKLTSGFRNPF